MDISHRKWNILVRIVPEYEMCCSLVVSAFGAFPGSRGVQLLLTIKPFTVSLTGNNPSIYLILKAISY